MMAPLTIATMIYEMLLICMLIQQYKGQQLHLFIWVGCNCEIAMGWIRDQPDQVYT